MVHLHAKRVGKRVEMVLDKRTDMVYLRIRRVIHAARRRRLTHLLIDNSVTSSDLWPVAGRPVVLALRAKMTKIQCSMHNDRHTILSRQERQGAARRVQCPAPRRSVVSKL